MLCTQRESPLEFTFDGIWTIGRPAEGESRLVKESLVVPYRRA
jgi:hypothetical protein